MYQANKARPDAEIDERLCGLVWERAQKGEKKEPRHENFQAVTQDLKHNGCRKYAPQQPIEDDDGDD